MNETFSANNPAMRVLSNMFNVFWVNLLFIFTCIPIITIGPSLCALYKVCLKIVSGDETQVYQTYFGEFKASFKKGLILWIGILVLGTFFGVELYFIYFRPDLSFLQYPVWIMIFLIVQVFLYGFALQATFENKLKVTIKNSILLSIKNFAITIFLIAAWLFTPLLINTFQDWTYGILAFELFFNLALRALICSFFLHKAFGLKKLRVMRDGTVREISYDDEEGTALDTDSDSEDSDTDSEDSSDEEGDIKETDKNDNESDESSSEDEGSDSEPEPDEEYNKE